MSSLAWLQDLIADFIAWLIPGRIGKAFALVVTVITFVGLMYVLNYRIISHLIH
jgi:hypothetical protein